LKSLINYIKDMQKKVDFFRNWVDAGTPKMFWLPGFYFTQSFFTGVKQNYARKKKLPIDQLTFRFDYLENRKDYDHPEVGCHIYCLFLEGAAWDIKSKVLIESQPKELFYELPGVHVVPKLISKVHDD